MRIIRKPQAQPISLIVAALLLCLGCINRAEDSPPPDRWLKLIATIPLPSVEGRIDHFAFDESGKRLFMAALGSDTVEVIDLNSGKVIDQIKGLATPQGIACAPAARQLAIANDKDGSCRIFDATTLKELARVDLKDDADNVRYDSASACFWVGYGQGALASIDLETHQKTGDIALDGHPESFQLETKGDRIFVNVPRAGHVAVIDRKKGAVIDKWLLKSAKANFPMALDEANHRLFIGCRQPGKLIVLDTQSGKEIAAIDCVSDTDDLFYDAASRRIYLIGGGGSVDVIEQTDADHYHHAASQKTAPGARTGFFNSATAQLYIAVPHRGDQKAELQIFQAETPK